MEKAGHGCAGEGGRGVCAAGMADVEWMAGNVPAATGAKAGGGAGEGFARMTSATVCKNAVRIANPHLRCARMRALRWGTRICGCAAVLMALGMGGCHGAVREPGTVVVILESSPNNLDPRQGTDAQSERVGGLIFDALVKKDEHYNLVPWLATSWGSSRTRAQTWVFHLRDGVRFQDGRPLEAADVVWTIESLIDPKLGADLRRRAETSRRSTGRRRATG
jgi:hypothetical protein